MFMDISNSYQEELCASPYFCCMEQFFTIYLNERPLILCPRQRDIPTEYKDAPVCPNPDAAAISQTLQALESGEIASAVFVQADTQRLLEAIKQHFKVLVAAGGLITNPEGEILLMFRRGKWDLPKGKLDEGETLEECAVREVQEETGLQEVELKKHLITTCHTYDDGHTRRATLKVTDWYLLTAPGNQKLVPQTVEQITKIEWAKPADFEKYMSNTFGAIHDVIKAAGY